MYICISICLFVLCCQTARPIRPKIGRNTHCDKALKIGGSAIASAHLCARKSAQTCAQHCPVRYRRPNGYADPGQNWQKYALGQCDEDRGVGDRECEFMRALPVQTCAHHCPGRYRRPNVWADPAQNWQKYSLGQCDEDRGAYPAKAAKRLDRLSPKLVHTLIGRMGKSYGSAH
jgi:hypothetical protein